MTEPAPIVHFLYEPGDGGLDRVAIYLANGMAERGIPTELWLTKSEGPLADLIAPGVKIRMVPTPDIGSRGVRLFLQIPALAKMIRSYRPRAVFSAGNQSNLCIAIANKLAGNGPTKIIQKITNPVDRPNLSRGSLMLRKWRFGFTSSLGDKTFVLSDSAAKTYAQNYPKIADRFVMAHLACVTPEMLKIGEEKRGHPPGATTQLLAAGRLAEQKDYPTMITALSLIKHRSWHLTIIGDGPQRASIEELVKEKNLSERIDIVGFVSDPAPFFSKADHLLLSSCWEGLGAVAIEAMATGCGVAATDCCDGLSDIIRQTGHQPAPIEDPIAFARSIEELLDNPVSQDKMREIAAPYTVEGAVSEHLELLESVENAS